MKGGTWNKWTVEEKKTLMDLMDQFPDLGPTSIAKVCKGMGKLPDRTLQAIKERVKILNAPEPEVEPVIEVPVQMQIDTEAMACDNGCCEKYESLLNTILGSASLNDFKTGLYLNFVTIRKWLWDNEPEKMQGRIEELRREMYGN